ncbi:GNAT family N-acetyltransferase [Gemmobacter fulvus]|uniref:GNAT family N-acetyltransferase n=1 Tax=Gemmobacter fulvus TaxID=2840474 RepID=A0A975S1I5_9RHOB|nr:GNAT family N-acetyltransferase [Gemmobacter fulvus]MBT9244980.1 GNAT family N-acetyltransferase [Gemmobacter fulvus]QWK90667.1 GNAT family N-acetyltransferase [Gemmobacter fulvus]
MTPRRATATDLPLVQACITAAFAPFVAQIGRRPAPMDADHAGQIAAGQVWLVDGPGVMACFAKPGAMELDILAIAPEAQGRGLAAGLVAQCEALARSAGLPVVELYTNAAMAGALRLYPRLGYAEIERRQDQGFDRVFFRKTL